ATITNDDASPSLIADNFSQLEGDSGTSTFNVTITRRGDTSGTSTVKYKTGGGTATAGTDYTPITTLGTLTFPGGDTSETVSVDVLGDTLPEANETFTLTLSAATGAVISDASATATIVNDDPAAFLSVNDPSVTEGDSASTTATFTITRSGNTSGTSTVKYKTGGGTATAGGDYTAVPLNTVTFGPTETTKTVDVTVNGDTVHEGNETLLLSLSVATGATISDASGTATITNDDASPSLIADNFSQLEGDSGTTQFNVTISRLGDISAASTVKIKTFPGSTNYDTSLATAAPGNTSTATDFTGIALTTVTFAAGETTKTIPVEVFGDTIWEYSEHFNMVLSSPTGATIADGNGKVTIVDEETDV
ncbi:MAG: hypothetical protein LC708_01395, partial [Actinobacteria bacterium]|nr:hypothetical protein [Actinomycetota bacterium]